MNSFVIANTEYCIGCRACEVACVLAHNHQQWPINRSTFRPRINVIHFDKQHTAVLCRHCNDAPCAKSCPTSALYLDNNQVMLDEEKCIGCKNCIIACPFGAITLTGKDQPDEADVAYKCDLCQSSTPNNVQACVQACPTKALQLIDEKTLMSIRKKRQFATATKQFVPEHRITAAQRIKQISPRVGPVVTEAAKRKKHFKEIYAGFTAEETNQQGSRCLQCADKAWCNWNCPLHNNIPQLIKLARENRILEAVELSHSTSSLPEICGRVCPQSKLCEGGCTLNREDTEAVTIGCIERYITDTALAMGWRPDLSQVKPIGKRVAIVGAGPAGLGCADILARNGVQAVVYDRHPEIGGLLTFGIPPFKLDKKLLAVRREIFTDMGIQFHLNQEVGQDISLKQLADDYDAVFLGVGTYAYMKAGLDNEDAPGVYDALPYLIANTRRVMGLPDDEKSPYISLKGKRVVVLGGGDTAMDCLRTAIRQQAAQVTCAYRRDEKNMPGSKKEVKNARDEGVEFLFNVQPLRIGLNKKGEVCSIDFIRTELGEPDASGRRRPQPIVGSEFTLESEAIIMAFGFKAHDMPWLEECQVKTDKWGLIATGKNPNYPGQTSNPKIFAGGDIIRGADLAVTAMADGRRAAVDILDMITRPSNKIQSSAA